MRQAILGIAEADAPLATRQRMDTYFDESRARTNDIEMENAGLRRNLTRQERDVAAR